MIKHLIPVGNSVALILDKPILELLRITPKTDLEISTDGNVLMVIPVRDHAEHDVKFKAAYERVLGRHGKTFKKLAKFP
jgi:antitoxin component of MazEF toxin-antitoxin module